MASINDFYFHSIIQDYTTTNLVLSSIINTGAIKAPVKIDKEKRYGCHKETDICLSKITDTSNIKDITIYLSCFDFYMNNFTSIMVDKEFDKTHKIIKPKLVSMMDYAYEPDLILSGDTTNIYDEYRTEDDISLEYLKGVCIPSEHLIEDPATFAIFIMKELFDAYLANTLDANIINMIRRDRSSLDDINKREEFVKKYVLEIKEMFDRINIDMPIYDYNSDKTFVRKI